MPPLPPRHLPLLTNPSCLFGKRSSATDKRPVLRGISLEVTSGEFLTILGESGSGKTTLLRLIAGFEELDSGEIWMGGERLDRIPAHRRQVNTVFQSYAIFPHLSVFENVAYGLARQERARRAKFPSASHKLWRW